MSEQRPIGSFANQVKRINEACTSKADVYSVTKYDGFVRSLDYFKKQVFSRDLSSYKIVKRGEFAYSTIHLDEGALGLLSDEEALISPMYTTFEVDESVDKIYLSYLLRSPELVSQYGLIGQGSVNRRKSVPFSSLAEIEVFTPPLPEQKKIAEILSGIDEATAKLIHKSQKLDALQASLTEELVQELQGKMDLAELQEHAEVRTGVAKNAKSEGDMTEMPYMRVANVQDGYLDLSEIKTISIDRGRIQRYLLQSGDVLINEGGDLDKVGRGVIWRGEIKECLHQNHVFAVRCSERLTPEFLSLLLKSAYSKNYFLGCAKQTTNLASINSTQLKQFPIPVPDLQTQEKFIRNITAVKELNSAITSEISGLEATKKAVASDLLSGRKRVSV